MHAVWVQRYVTLMHGHTSPQAGVLESRKITTERAELNSHADAAILKGVSMLVLEIPRTCERGADAALAVHALRQSRALKVQQRVDLQRRQHLRPTRKHVLGSSQPWASPARLLQCT